MKAGKQLHFDLIKDGIMSRLTLGPFGAFLVQNENLHNVKTTVKWQHAKGLEDDSEISKCLKMLKDTHADTGFMHESFHKDDAFNFSRSWFSWANTLFGEFVIKVYNKRPWLLKNNFS